MPHYKLGYYKPTFEFTRIPEFMAILDEQGNLVGLTGPATSRQAALDARLFSAAPDLLFALKTLSLLLEEVQQNTHSQPSILMDELKLEEALSRARAIIHQVENGNRAIDSL